jgi:hypothetical protein
LANLSYKAAATAKTAAQNALAVNTLLTAFRASLVAANIAVPTAFDTALAAAQTAALASQTAANSAITSYNATLVTLGITGSTILPSTGTTGASGTTGT